MSTPFYSVDPEKCFRSAIHFTWHLKELQFMVSVAQVLLMPLLQNACRLVISEFPFTSLNWTICQNLHKLIFPLQISMPPMEVSNSYSIRKLLCWCQMKYSANSPDQIYIIVVPAFASELALPSYLVRLLPTVGHFLDCHHLISVGICSLEEEKNKLEKKSFLNPPRGVSHAFSKHRLSAPISHPGKLLHFRNTCLVIKFMRQLF